MSFAEDNRKRIEFTAAEINERINYMLTRAIWQAIEERYRGPVYAWAELRGTMVHVLASRDLSTMPAGAYGREIVITNEGVSAFLDVERDQG